MTPLFAYVFKNLDDRLSIPPTGIVAQPNITAIHVKKECTNCLSLTKISWSSSIKTMFSTNKSTTQHMARRPPNSRIIKDQIFNPSRLKRLEILWRLHILKYMYFVLITQKMRSSSEKITLASLRSSSNSKVIANFFFWILIPTLPNTPTQIDCPSLFQVTQSYPNKVCETSNILIKDYTEKENQPAIHLPNFRGSLTEIQNLC